MSNGGRWQSNDQAGYGLFGEPKSTGASNEKYPQHYEAETIYIESEITNNMKAPNQSNSPVVMFMFDGEEGGVV